ncbi:MAG TPA: hypothetical protein VFQ90_07015 [Stellaceae bacterium]|nr:hypothetical protein [Stellaceae bacterium]
MFDETVLGRCMHQHTHQPLIRFLNGVEREVPAGKMVHASLEAFTAPQQS